MRLPIGGKILLTMLVVALPSLLLFSALMVKSRGEILFQNVTNQLNELADLSLQTVQDLVHDSKASLLTIAGCPDVRDLLAAQSTANKGFILLKLRRLERSFLDFQTLDKTLQGIRYLDENGLVLVKIREGKVMPRQGSKLSSGGFPSVSSKAGRDFFLKAMQLKQGQIWISNLERGWMEGESSWCPAMVRFATPLFHRDGSRAGVLVINVWGKAIGTMINRLIPPQEGSAFIIERNLKETERHGIFLFHPQQSCEFGNQTGNNISVFTEYPQALTMAWMTKDQGTTKHPGSGDILVHRYYSPYGEGGRGWVIVVEARHDIFMAPMLAMKNRILASVTAIFILMIAAALLFARNLTRPIRNVIDGTHLISHNLSQRIVISSHDEIGLLAQEINTMAETLEQNQSEKRTIEEKISQAERLSSVGVMAAGLAHEINTPLGNIKALAVLARKDIASGAAAPQDSAQDLLDIIKQTEKCSAIIGGLLGFARKQSSNFSLHNINEVVANAISLVRIRSDKKDIQVSLERDPNLPHIKIDDHQIEQVCVNILLNGIDACTGPDSIVVTTSFSGSRLSISIADSGPGIKPELLNKIFDPFFTTKEVGKGTGLGLSLSYGIIKNHGGNIEVSSPEGRGAIFVILLPINTDRAS